MLEVAAVKGRERLVAVHLARREANAVRRRSHNCTGLFTETQQDEKKIQILKHLNAVKFIQHTR